MKNKKPILFYGYIILAAAFCIRTTAWGANRTFGVFLEPMLNEFGWTRAGISGPYTLAMILTGVTGIVAGRLTDRFGPSIVVVGCGLLLGLGYILMSRVEAIWQFYLFYGIIAGVGMGGYSTTLFSIVVRWFKKRRALMSGILNTGPAFGIVVMPLVFTLLISDYGWRTSYLMLGVIVLVIIVLAALFLRRDPRKMGLLPYGASKRETEGLDLQEKGLSFNKTVRTRQFWLLSVIAFCDLFLVNVIVVHIVIHMVGLGITATTAASVLSIGAAVSIPARIIIGGIADNIGYKRALTIVFIMSFLAFLLLLVARDLWMLYVFAVIYGVGLWASFTVMAPLIADLFGLKSLATNFACVIVSGTVGGAIGPVLVGYIFDITGSYQPAFMLCLLISVIPFVSLMILRPVTIK
ncbi:MFS transporter [Chloroflexota bacterium]